MTDVQNCLTCGTGSMWWHEFRFALVVAYYCPICDGDPTRAGSGRPDWQEVRRERMNKLFGAHPLHYSLDLNAEDGLGPVFPKDALFTGPNG